MRGSPISNLRGRQDYSPYESNPRSSNVGHDSPPRYGSAGEVEYWRGKARQL
jgi:hypothetical protein